MLEKDFSKTTILGPKRIEAADEVFDIYELLKVAAAKDDSIVTYKTAKIQLRIGEHVEPDSFSGVSRSVLRS